MFQSTCIIQMYENEHILFDYESNVVYKAMF